MFALPILGGNVFQLFYNIADTMVVGHVLGEVSLAAVGSTAAVYSLIISFANGMANGFSIIAARFFGGKESDKLKQAFATSICLTVVIAIILTVIGQIFLIPMLKLLNTPSDIINEAHSYISVILAFVIVTMFYNVLAGILRAVGNSKMPLLFLVIASVVNVILVFVFVAGARLGVRGAAIATVISQILSLVLCIIYIIKKCPFLHLSRKDFKLEKQLVTELFTTGLSMALMLSIVAIGTVILQGAINDFGKETIAAHTAARRISEIFMLPVATIGVAASTFTSQNYGARNFKRIATGINYSFLIVAIWVIISNIIIFLFASDIVTAITGSDKTELIATSTKYLRINLPFYAFLAILVILRNVLQGMGSRIIPIVSSFIEFAGKFLVVGVLVPSMGYLGVCISEPMIWFACSVLVGTTFVLRIRKLSKT
jgi:putative MATE family efflux protein